jgi:choline dehydrogenase-like flavoprotein
VKRSLFCVTERFLKQLLMLSGVGPAAHLESKGIKVIKNIAEIGQNLQDHPAVTVMNDISKPIAITDKIFQKGTGKVST